MGDDYWWCAWHATNAVILGRIADMPWAGLDAARADDAQYDVAAFIHNLAMLMQQTGDYDTAAELYQQSLQIFEDLGNRAGMATSYGQLANLARVKGDSATAEKYYLQGMNIAEEIGDIVSMSIQMFNLALLYESQERFGEAVPLLEKSVAIAEHVGLPVVESRRKVLEGVRGKIW